MKILSWSIEKQNKLIKSKKLDQTNLLFQKKIPSNLYQEPRDIDLKQFYFLWVGIDKLPPSQLILNGNTVHNYKSIYYLVNAFLLKEDLPFVKILSELYGNDTH